MIDFLVRNFILFILPWTTGGQGRDKAVLAAVENPDLAPRGATINCLKTLVKLPQFSIG
jgi:hypothetical protein